MELFIPGIILVALMVYASTRIKKTAAAAYKEESIETDRFDLIKPDGFLSPVDPPDALLFAAYSKDFGDDESGELHRASIELKFFPDLNIEERIAEIKDEIDVEPNAEGIVNNADTRSTVAGKTYVNGIETNVKHLLIAGDNGVYDLYSSILDDFYEEYSYKINAANASFNLK